MEKALNSKIVDNELYEIENLRGKFCSSYHEIKPSDGEMKGQGNINKRIPEARDCLARALLDPKCT